MQTIISSRHFKLYQEVKSEIIAALEDFNITNWKLNKVEVVLNRTHKKFHVEILISGKEIHLESKFESADLLGAFYKAHKRSMKQLKRIIEKRNNHKAIHLADLDILAEELTNKEYLLPA